MSNSMRNRSPTYTQLFKTRFKLTKVQNASSLGYQLNYLIFTKGNEFYSSKLLRNQEREKVEHKERRVARLRVLFLHSNPIHKKDWIQWTKVMV